ncbi:PT repeat family protein [Colletotrichum tofieldiae]|uniref:PT repeat family protein n=1 Tax=Colletotrichum tofieldiae TaxID=708197 RepID=A0A166UYP1_9PEZI|nr:PT repeat family protein [Colletotrichum tofieldiae]GKT83196.1 PT repeat family protein [Colletotrichum tofieldiae]
MAEPDLVRPSTSHSGASGFQRRFLLSSPGRPRTATGHSEPKFTPTHSQAGLAVRVRIKFQPSLDLTYERQYQSSYGFEPTDQICHALVRRLTHCSNELLTRRDSTALERTIPQIGEGKPLRFELVYQIYRGGPEPWATKTFRSYQKYPIDKPSAMEIARSTDRIIGSFLKLHDKSFRWMHGRTRERSSSDLEMLKPLSNPVSLLHIPQSRFVEATQDWEFVPGYEITLSFRSRCKSRRQREWQRTITLKSKQSSPLTLSHGEDMAWVLSTAMQRALDARKMAFDRQHRSCNRYDFLDECRHSEQNAVHVGFQIRNQLGLDHRHLRRELDSNLLLFQDPAGLDCEQFLSQLEHAFEAVRDDTDKELSELDDLRLTVYELSGRGWKAEKPFAVCLDSTACYSRRTVKAILDRVQTGVADILGGNDMSITLMVHKRGHLVLDKTLVARSPYYATGQRQDEDPETVKEHFVSKLKDRIQSDLAMVIKDTCSLSDCEPQNIRIVERPVPAANDPAEMEALPSSSPFPIPTPNGVAPASFDGSFTEPSEPSGLQGETLQNGSGVETTPESVNDTVGLSQQPETPAKAIAFKDQLDSSGRSSLSFSTTEDGETTYPSSSSTPSLVDGDIGTPHESLLVTPTFMRTLSGSPQHFDANPNIASSETSDSDLIEDSLAGPPTPTMQRFNGPRQFSLMGKGSRSVSRQSLVSTDSGSEKQSLTDSEASPSPESDDAVVQVQEVASESEAGPESASARSPALPDAKVEPAALEPALEGWLEYCCVPVDAEEQAAESGPDPVAEAEVYGNAESTRKEPVIVITPAETRPRPTTPPRSFEGFLEYAIETIVEEDEEDSDAEFHDADSPSAMAVMSSPSSFATATETGLSSPINFEHAALSPLVLDSATPSPNLLDSASPFGNIEKGSLPPPAREAVEDAASALGSAVKVDSCTSYTIEPTTSAPHVPEAIEPPFLPEVTEEPTPQINETSTLPEATEAPTPQLAKASPTPEALPVPEPSEPCTPETAEPSSLSAEPFEPILDSSKQSPQVPSSLTLTETQSVSSEAPRTPTSGSVPSFSDRDDEEEAREPSTPPPLMTEAEDSDYSEPSEPAVPFPEFPDHDRVADTADVHDDTSMSLSHWSQRASFFLPDEASESYFGHLRKLSVPRPLFSRPDSGVTPFSRPFLHKRQISSPTAGLFGLHEPRRLDIGLRGALLGIAALQKQSKLERRPSQVLLRLENDRGMVVVPGNSRRNSETRGIGGAGVLGLGNAFAF